MVCGVPRKETVMVIVSSRGVLWCSEVDIGEEGVERRCVARGSGILYKHTAQMQNVLRVANISVSQQVYVVSQRVVLDCSSSFWMLK